MFTEPKNFEAVKSAIEAKGIKWISEELTKIPNSTLKITGNDAKQLLALIEILEDNDDVQKVYANFDIPDEVLEEMAQEI